jgi:CO dehydrogenase maturation factor
MPLLAALRRARQADACPPDGLDDMTALWWIAERAHDGAMTPERRTALLRDLHLKLAKQSWVRNAYGDVTRQLGPVLV